MASLGDSARKLSRKFGVEVFRYPMLHDTAVTRLRIMRDRRINLVLDVGANIGQYASDLRGSGYGGQITSFEPVAEYHQQLARRAADDARWQTRPLALGATDGSAEINVGGTLSSLLEAAPGSDFVQYQGRETIRIARLDTLADELIAGDDRAWLKVDVQGLEPQVLDGAAAALGRVVAVELELSLKPHYKGQTTYRPMMDRLGAAGFELWSLSPTDRDGASGRLREMDGIFVRPGA